MSSQVRSEWCPLWGPSQHRETLSTEPVSPARNKAPKSCRSSGSDCGDGSCCLVAVVVTSPSPHLTSPHLTMSITPDLIEWLLADQKVSLQSPFLVNIIPLCVPVCQVCQGWRRLAARMSLSCYVGYIESQEKSNSASLRLLLRLWSQAKPDSYNVKGLKRVLAAEVSADFINHIHLRSHQTELAPNTLNPLK